MTYSLSNNTKVGFAITGIFLSVAGLLFNISGIYTLVRTKPRGNKQTYLLINVGTISLCMCLLFISDWVLNGLMSIEMKVIGRYLLIAESASCIVLATSAITLSTDRLLAIAVPFRHRTIVTSKFIRISISLCWFIGLSTRVPFLLMSHEDNLLHMIYLDVSINTINILFQPITYIFILFKWRQRRKTINNNSHIGAARGTRATSYQARDSKREARMLKIALMVASSCIFSGICDIIYASYGLTTQSPNPNLLSQIAFLMWNMVPLFQSLLYILIKPEIRRWFLKILCIPTGVE